MNNLGDTILLNANRYPDKTALVYRGKRFTYGELNKRINRLAHHFLDLGVNKGDRVGFMFYNSNQFIEIFYATMKIGAIAVPLNYRLVPREVKWCLDTMNCKIFAYGEACAEQVNPVKKEFLTVEHLIYSGSEACAGEYHFEAFAGEGDDTEPGVTVEFNDPAYVIFTGGTTGIPKAPLHTHRSAIFGLIHMSIMNQAILDEVVISQMPMFHIGGLAQLRILMAMGGTMLLVDSFDTQEILGLIEREKVTWLTLLPPTTFIRILDFPKLKDYDTTSVKRVSTSVGAFAKPLMLNLFDIFPNARLLYGYAQTETGNGGTMDFFTRSMIEQDLDIVKSIGRAMPFNEIRLVDDEGRDVPVGEVGEAILRSPSNMSGYYGQPELTAQTLKDGWVYTGDLFRKDKNGYYYFSGRNKDMIKTGGENVYAEEVEKVILSHPGVEVCAVIGVPDDRLSEAVMAVIKPRKGFDPTEEEIVEHCKQYLSSYKKPRRVAFTEDFPVTDQGKIQKFKLVERYGPTPD